MHGVSYNQTPMDLSGIDQPNQLDSQDNLTPQQHVPNPFKDMPGKRGPGDTYYSNNWRIRTLEINNKYLEKVLLWKKSNEKRLYIIHS
jgi:hypothetical protein